MRDNFKDLWDALSKPGVSEGRLRARLARRPGSPVPPKLSSTINGYPGTRRRNVFQSDLQILGELVIEDLPRNPAFEVSFLQECYTPSGALSQFALLSKNLLSARNASLFGITAEAPALQPVAGKTGVTPELFADSLSQRPILLLGGVGAGKTTFIRNLIRVEAPEIFTQGLTLYVDLGAQGALALDLRQFVLEEIRRQLLADHGVDIEEAKFVRGIYHSELARFRKGIYSRLADTDPAAFSQKELEFLEDKLSNLSSHLRTALRHLEQGRRQQIVLFADNADQREADTQQRAFLIAHEVASNWPVMVFLALRPETFHNSLRSGALSGYHPRAFTVAPPRIDRVVIKRLGFALKIARGELPLSMFPEQAHRFARLALVLESLKDSVERNERLMEAIDNLSSGNVRAALDFIRTFLGSGHVDTEKIYNIAQETGSYTVPLHEFLRAVIYGDSAYYDPTRSPVANLFDISSPDRREHFLLPVVLQYVLTLPGDHGEEGFVDATKIYLRLQDLGFLADQIDSALTRAIEKKLVESRGEAPASRSLRMTPLGAYHLQRLSRFFTYIDAIVVDTPVLDAVVRAEIHEVLPIADRLERVRMFLAYLNTCWDASGLSTDAFDWPSASRDIEQELEDVRRRIDDRY